MNEYCDTVKEDSEDTLAMSMRVEITLPEDQMNQLLTFIAANPIQPIQ